MDFTSLVCVKTIVDFTSLVCVKTIVDFTSLVCVKTRLFAPVVETLNCHKELISASSSESSLDMFTFQVVF